MIRIPPQNTLVERKASNFTLPSPNLSNLCGGVFPVQTNCIGMLAIKLIGGEFKKKGKERKKKKHSTSPSQPTASTHFVREGLAVAIRQELAS